MCSKKEVVKLRILNFEQQKNTGGVKVTAMMSMPEFQHLVKNLDKIGTFDKSTVIEPASTVKTGAKHSYAKYLLFPVKLRRQFQTDSFDFDKLACGALAQEDTLYVIYRVPRK